MASAHSALPGPLTGQVERVVDGDTLAVRVTVWIEQDIRVLVRVRGIDAPEMRARCPAERERAEQATAKLAALVGDQPVVLKDVEGDKYFGRVLADVATPGGDVAARMIADGLARPYDGGRRGGWCDAAEAPISP